MKILVVSQHFYPEAFRINDICFELVKRGHDVTVLTGLPNYPEGVVYEGYRHKENRDQWVNGVHIVRCHLIGRGKTAPQFGLNYLWFARSGIRKARQLRGPFDVIYSFQTSPVSMAYPALEAKRKFQIPLVLHCLDQWPISVTAGPIQEGSLFYRWLYGMSRNVYSQADVITITSQSFKAYFEDVLQLSAGDYGLVYWPQYAEDTYKQTEVIRNGIYDILFAGNIGPASDVETIVKAAELLKDETRIFFHIVGGGMNLTKCEKLAADAGLKNIRFYGAHPVEEMPQYYSLADALLITMTDKPVINSTLPGKMQSYMVTGKPIIGAINGETKRVIEEAGCGVCVSSGNVEGLAKAIRDLSNDEEDHAGYGARAKAYYDDHFDKTKQIGQLEEILQGAVRNGVLR